MIEPERASLDGIFLAGDIHGNVCKQPSEIFRCDIVHQLALSLRDRVLAGNVRDEEPGIEKCDSLFRRIKAAFQLIR